MRPEPAEGMTFEERRQLIMAAQVVATLAASHWNVWARLQQIAARLPEVGEDLSGDLEMWYSSAHSYQDEADELIHRTGIHG